MRIEIQLLDPDIEIPSYAKPGDAGLDLRSRVDMKLEPGMRALVPTGLAIAIPEGYVGLVHPRSGLAIKNGISMVNTPGTIDSGYRGEIAVILINHDREETFEIKRGDRIAQLVIQQVEIAELVAVKELPMSQRGAGGFGSSGVR
ncbi:MAG: dUTP diphosphatase [Actinobacteria bacterium]|jgi:dUTP pyrophosphatase|nr:dUTP diphosphatase [Actinomycetota bacterium]NDB08106.1 dUTP diphosphatase [Actinomycetota bacterium]NDI09653.1 dUTP diphosphatase [Actinomycetota bacterium]